MPAFELFTDWYDEGSGPVYLSDPKSVINDASIRNYELCSRLMSDGKMEVKGGNQIKSTIQLSDSGTAETFLPGDVVDIQNVQTLKSISAPWRQLRGQVAWTDVEIDDEVSGIASGKGMYHKFADIKKAKDQAGLTSALNLMEKKLAASFSAANTDNGSDPYSVFYSVTSDGLAPSGATLVHGQNPSTETAWRNQNVSYTAATPFDTQNGIVAGMDQMRLLVKFKKPSQYGEYFTDSSLRNQVIATNREGHYTMSQALRAANDITRAGANDPAYDPVYDNRPIVAVEAFDDQSSFTSGQPGYLFLDFNHFKMICKSGYTGKPTKSFDFGEKPDTMVKYFVWRYNVVNMSRRRHGYLSGS